MEVEEEEPQQGSGCAAVVVVTVFTAVPLALLWLWSRDAFILLVWLIAAVSIICAARRPGKIENPSPPPPEEPSPDASPQVSTLRDKSHPNRWVIARPSRWLTYTHNDRDES